MDRDLKRSIILDNYQNPNMKHTSNEDYVKINTRNVSCIDNLDIYLKIEDNIIKDISFEGEACVISISSTNILANMLVGKTKEEGIYIIDNYLKMINEEEYDKDVLKELLAFDDTSRQPSRIKCATLSANGIKDYLEEEISININKDNNTFEPSDIDIDEDVDDNNKNNEKDIEDNQKNNQNLNLTYAVRDGIVSHCGEIDENGLKPRDEYIDLNNYNKPNEYAPYTWEGCTVKIADKISYLGRDIEDAISLGILDEHLEELYELLNYGRNEVINNTVIINDLIYDLCNNSSIEKGLYFSDKMFNKIKEIKNFSNFDLDTMLKMKAIIENMNKGQNDPRANLLKSLKPYLKQSRKNKVDQYIKLFSMGKAFEILNPLGGEKKNDV